MPESAFFDDSDIRCYEITKQNSDKIIRVLIKDFLVVIFNYINKHLKSGLIKMKVCCFSTS